MSNSIDGSLSPSLSSATTNKRRLVLFTVVFVNFLVWMDSGKFGLLTPFWSADLHFSTGQIGTISSAYLLGYFPMLIIAGFLADRIGPKPLLIICVSGVTVLGVSMIFVQTYSELYWRNLIFGVFFGLLWAPCQRMLSVWFPFTDIARVTAIWVAAQMFTSIVEPLIGLPMAEAWGWRPTFIVISVLGIPGLLGLIFWTTSNPASRKGISESELALIRSNRPPAATRLPAREILKSFKNPTVIFLIIAGALATTPTWLTATWGSYGIITVGKVDPNVAAYMLPLVMIIPVGYSFLHGGVVNRFFKGHLKTAMLVGVMIPAIGFFIAGTVIGMPWILWAFCALTLGYMADPLVWGSLNPFFVKVSRPEVVGTLNGIAAGLQVAGGYVLVSLSGKWIDSSIPGFGSMSKIFIVGGFVFVAALIPILLTRENAAKRMGGTGTVVMEESVSPAAVTST